MAHASRLSLALALGSLAACAAEGPSPDGTPGPIVSGEDSTEAASPFAKAGGGYVADAAHHQVAVTDGALRISDRAGGSIQLATDGIARDESVAAALASTAPQADGALRLDRGAVTELLENRADGVEQSWRFAEAPAGDADLVVRVRVSGVTAASRNDRGLVLRAGAAGFAYSDATWVDAHGARRAIPVAWTGDHVEIRVPAEVVDASAYPAILDPTISSEAGVEPVLAGFTGARAREPSIARSSNRFLVVWRDDRVGYASGIWAARVDDTGALQDLDGLRVATSSVDLGAPKVAWVPNAGLWLVVWTVNDTDIAAATVKPDGTIAQLGTVVGTAAQETAPDLAADGGVAMLVFQSGTDVRAVRYGPTGFGTPFDVAVDGAVEDTLPTVANSAGGDFLVAWQSGATAANIRGQLVTRAGALSGAAFDVSVDAGVQSAPAAAWAGTNYVVTWKSGQTSIWGARVSTAGVVLDTTTTIGGVAIGTGTTILTDPEVSCDATNCLFAWEDRKDTVNNTVGAYGQLRAAADFTAVGSVITVNDGTRSQDAIAIESRAGGGHAVVFADRAIGVHSVSLVRTNAAGAVQDATPVLVSRGTKTSQRHPGFAKSAAGQLAIWQDSRVFGDDIYALRYNTNGGKVDPSPGGRVVSNGANTQNGPVIDYDGTQYVVAWSDTRNATFDIYAARFKDDGTNLDPAGIALSTAARNQTAPAIAAGAGSSLVVWGDESVTASRSDIVGAIVNPDGTFTTFDVCRTTNDQQNPAVAWDPTNAVYVVAWEDFRGGTDFDIYATRVQGNGTVLDGCGVLVGGGAGDQRGVEVATAGSQQLAVWEDYGTDVGGDIRGARLSAAGALTVVGSSTIASGAAPQINATVGGLDNGRWSLAWEDRGTPAQGSDIVGNEMSAAGALLGPQYAIAASTEWEHGPRFQSGVNGTNVTYLMYQRTKAGSSIVKTMRRKLTH